MAITVADVRAGSRSAVITEDGDLYIWGFNSSIILGDKTSNNVTLPRKILTGIKQVSLGSMHIAALA